MDSWKRYLLECAARSADHHIDRSLAMLRHAVPTRRDTARVYAYAELLAAVNQLNRGRSFYA